jgi:hypothetical protein
MMVEVLAGPHRQGPLAAMGAGLQSEIAAAAGLAGPPVALGALRDFGARSAIGHDSTVNLGAGESIGCLYRMRGRSVTEISGPAPAIRSKAVGKRGITIARIAPKGYSCFRMKRVVWLVLAVFCAALAQVQPVDGLGTKAKPCPCCHPGACGMPGCCPPPASASTAFSSAQAESVRSVPAPRRAQAARGPANAFYAAFAEPAHVRSSLLATAQAAPAASLPLFKAHCSFLI